MAKLLKEYQAGGKTYNVGDDLPAHLVNQALIDIGVVEGKVSETITEDVKEVKPKKKRKSKKEKELEEAANAENIEDGLIIEKSSDVEVLTEGVQDSVEEKPKKKDKFSFFKSKS